MNKLRIKRSVSTALLLSVSLPSFVLAQTTTQPDAGSISKQIEQTQKTPIPQAKRPTVTQAPEMKPSDGMAIKVTQFNFSGNTRLSSDALQKLLAPMLNRTLQFEELQYAAATVAAAYRDAGWIVRAYIPEQEIANGIITIQISEAILGGVEVQKSGKLRLREKTARQMVFSAHAIGGPLHGESIDRALLLINDLPGVGVKGNLKEGKNEGETDILLQLDPRSLITGDVNVDNVGSKSTGSTRLSGTINFNSLLGVGDLTTGNLVHTSGSDYLRGAWSLPMGYTGLRLGTNVSSLKYKVNSADFARLDLHGDSTAFGLFASYPLVRSTMRNVYLNVSYDKKDYNNKSSDIVTSDYGIQTLETRLTLNQFDHFYGGGNTTFMLGVVNGSVNLDGSPNRLADAAGPQTQGSFAKVKYSFNRLQTITPTLSGYIALNGQTATENLDSAEKMYLGGSSGVRAYPSSEAGGAEGNVWNLELRYRLHENYTLSTFFDRGSVKVNRKNNFPGAATANEMSLKGVGLALAWSTQRGINGNVTWARRLGTNPNQTSAGNDQDGTLVKNRLWLNVAYPF